MNMLKLAAIIAYLGVNAVFGGCIYSFVTTGQTSTNAFLSAGGLITASLLILCERSLPNKLKIFQVALSLLMIMANMNGTPNAKIGALVMLVIVGVIKAYAVYLSVSNIKEKFEGKGPQTQAGSGKDFYNSQAWRKLRYATLNKQGRCCVSCGEDRVKDDNGKLVSYHVDHIKPRSKFPHLALDPNNMQVLCEACNLGKSNHWDIDHREERGIA